MLLAAIRDLQYRIRRFAITVIGTALVLALTLLLAGISSAFAIEAKDTVRVVPADGWVVGQDAKGPFLSATPLPASVVDQIAAIDGVDEASGMAFVRQAIGESSPRDVNVVGAEPGGVGMPVADKGRAPEKSGEIMVSSRLGMRLGDTLQMGGMTFEVVGEVSGSTALAGVPNVIVPLADGQKIAFAGQPVVTSVAFTGSPRGELPKGLIVVDKHDARNDLLRPVNNARSGIQMMSILLWIVAGSIIGSITYLSALRAEREFAVFKAIGWSNRSLLVGIAFQAAALALVAAAVGAVGASLLAPAFPLRVMITPLTYVLLPIVAVVVSFAASAAGLRRVTRVDPSSAFS